MTSGHFIYIPAILMIGVVLGFLFGKSAARDAFDMERKREEERKRIKAEREAKALAAYLAREHAGKKILIVYGEVFYRRAIAKMIDQALSPEQKKLTRLQSLADVTGASDRVRLVPRTNDPDTREIVVIADADGRIVSLDILDLQGNRSTFRFEDLQENVGLGDKMFEFKVPHGVEVVAG